MFLIRFYLPLFYLLFHPATIFAASSENLEIVEVLPALNDVSDVRQISIRFNYPIVEGKDIGVQLSAVPIKISPNTECSWRWIDEYTMVCNLGKSLNHATEYEISVSPLFESLDKKYKMSAAFIHKFITLRPKVTYSWVENWLSDSRPVFGVTFNQPVTGESLRNHVYFLGAGSSRIDAELSYDSARGYSESISNGVHSDRLPKDSGYSWFITPEKDVVGKSEISLVIEAGVSSIVGKSPSNDIFKKSVENFGAFEFVGMECQSFGDGNFVKVSDLVKCDPEGGFSLLFNAPVSAETIKDKFLFYSVSELGADKKEEYFNTLIQNYSSTGNLPYEHKKGDVFRLPMNGILTPERVYRVTSVREKSGVIEKFISLFRKRSADSASIRDVFNRSIENKVDITFATSKLKPMFRVKDYAHASVLEKDYAGKIYINVGGIDELKLSYKRFMANEVYENDLSVSNKIPAESKQKRFDVSFDIADLLNGNSGMIYGNLSSSPSTQVYKNGLPLFVEVTPYEVFAKIGQLNTIVWVLGLKDGLPVQGATVSLYQSNLSKDYSLGKALSKSVTDQDGITVLPGVSNFELVDSANYYQDIDSKLFFVKVESNNNVAILPLYYEFLTDTYTLLNSASYFDMYKSHIKGWGSTTQGIYKIGDIVKYKVYLREEMIHGLSSIKDGYTYSVVVSDSAGNPIHKVDNISLSDFGSYAGEFVIPSHAIVGNALIKILATKANQSKDIEIQPMTFLITDFHPSSFKITSSLNKESFVGSEKIQVKSFAEFYSGGAYPSANVRFTSFIRKRNFSELSPELSGFVFGKNDSAVTEVPVYEHSSTLDGQGIGLSEFQVTPSNFVYGDLIVETLIADERGKYVSNSKKAKYFASNVLVGLRSPEWPTVAGKSADIEYVAADSHGKMVGNIDIDIRIEKEDVFVSKVKNENGIYENVYTRNRVEVHSCKVKSQSDKPGVCSFTPKDAGSYRALASITGNVFSEVNFSVAGSNYVVWDTDNRDKFIEILSEKDSFEVGDTARYFVKNPYPGAKALVTIERAGVIDSFVKTFDTASPIIEFAVKEEYLPGYYLSVVVFTPRIGSMNLDDKGMDQGAPKARFGYIKTEVKKKAENAVINIKTDKDSYKPDEKVHLNIQVDSANINKSKELELSVLVVDESLIDLLRSGLSYFNPYEGFYSIGHLGVMNYNLVNRVNAFSKRVASLKGVSDGGDGAADPATDATMPSVTDSYVAYWDPFIRTTFGRSFAVDFDLPKVFTKWRIIVSALDKDGFMAFSTSTIVANKDIELRDALPKVVVSGDRFNAKFTVYNRTDGPKNARIDILVESKSLKNNKILFSKKVVLDSFDLSQVAIPIELNELTPDDIKFTLKVSSGKEELDSLTRIVRVQSKEVPIYVGYYSSTSQSAVSEKIFIPSGTIPEKSSISVYASASTVADLKSDFANIRKVRDDISTEIVLSRAVASVLYKSLFNDNWGDSLPKEAIERLVAVQSSDGGIGYFANGYPDPYLTVYTRFALNLLKENGYRIPLLFETKLDGYIKEILSGSRGAQLYSIESKSDVIAFALFAFAKEGKVNLKEVVRYSKYVPTMSLFGKAQFLRAIVISGGKSTEYKEVLRLILDSQNKTQGKVIFSEKSVNGYSDSLFSHVKSGCVVLSALLSLPDSVLEKEVGEALFKVVRGIISMKRGGYAFNSQELVFCARAFNEYAKRYDIANAPESVGMKFDDEDAINLVQGFDSVFYGKRKIVESDISKNHILEISRKGTGRLYYSYLLELFGSDRKEAINSGMSVKRFYSTVKNSLVEPIKAGECIKRGDMVRVDLFVSIPAKRMHVVLDDFVPGGFSVVNTNLATEMTSADFANNAAMKAGGDSSSLRRNVFSNEHISANHVKFYVTHIDAGEYHISYNAQAVAAGSFYVMPSMVIETYDPDVFGSTEAASICIIE